MMKEIKGINRKIWYGIGAFVIICFIVIGISFKINTDAQKEETQTEQEEEGYLSGPALIETLQGQDIHTQANVIAYMLSQDVYEKDYIRATLNLDKNLVILIDLPFYENDNDTIEVASAFAHVLFKELKMMLELNPNSVETVNIGFITTFIDGFGNDFEKLVLGFNADKDRLLSTNLDNVTYKDLDFLCFDILLDPSFDLNY